MRPSAAGPGQRAPIFQISDVVWQPERAATFEPPAELHLAGNLTDWLAKAKSFTDSLLPASRSATGAINKFLTQRPSIGPCASTRDSMLYSRVALAVDRGVLQLSGVDVASPAVKFLDNVARYRHDAAVLAAVMRAYAPPRRGHFRKRHYLGWLYVLGALDTASRGFRPLDDAIVPPLPMTVSRTTAAEWLADSIPNDVATETADLLRSLRLCRPPGKFVENPIIGGTLAFGGSDGDWIAGDTLVELKCVTSFKRDFVAQLLCYYFIDRSRKPSERFNFRRLALCLARHCTTVVGTPDEWLAAFGGAPEEVVVEGVHRYWGQALK